MIGRIRCWLGLHDYGQNRQVPPDSGCNQQDCSQCWSYRWKGRPTLRDPYPKWQRHRDLTPSETDVTC